MGNSTHLSFQYKPHPVAAMFPMLPEDGQHFKDLVDSIKHFGQLDPVVVDGGVILDGRNRLRACEVAKVEPRIVSWSSLPLRQVLSQAQWIVAKNIDRRHLTDDQRVSIAYDADCWQLRQDAEKNQKAGVPLKAGEGEPKRKNATAEKVAEKAKVSRHKAEQAIKLAKAVESGAVAPEVSEAVKTGTTTLLEAVKKIPGKPKPEKSGLESKKLRVLKMVWLEASEDHQVSFIQWVGRRGNDERALIVHALKVVMDEIKKEVQQ
ncbi:MAG: hypothetical protein JWM16_6443 [Verrucomicrobiales bacterium]|nr:hypothetical protein [Verrucomicrobiales bacterium]